MTTASRGDGYPGAHVVDVALRDGSSLHIRPVVKGDAGAIREFLEGLSRESIGFRFFGSPNLDWVCDWSVDVDYVDRYALIATTGPHGEVVAHGAYMRLDERRAEVAFVVADRWQGMGIATIMLAHLAAAACEHGIATFFAEVLPHNHRMIDVFVQSGFPVTRHDGRDAIEIELPTSITQQTTAHFDERDRIAAVAALKRFLQPRSVAVIGASRRRQTIGGELWHNLVQGGFAGNAYPVNEHASSVQGAAAFASIEDVPGPVELAVIATPAERVADAARQCARAGVRSLLVISGGFGETGEHGRERQRELLSICREHGMRLIGPNCMGVLNTSGDVRLNATFAPGHPRPGSVGFLSQSGGLGIAIVEWAERFGIGLSSFVSVGDKADISGNDLLQYWEQDEATDVVLLYLESFGNPRRFARIARRVSHSKPIVAVKSGRSAAGARAGASHTGALVATSDVTVDALFAQAGVIRTDTVQEQFDVAALLAGQPVPKGKRVAIVTNAGGPGILCADACQAGGLDVVELPAETQAQLARFLDRNASLHNPVDMIASASAEDYRRTIEILAAAKVCDAILAIFVPPLVTAAADVARAIHAATAATGEVALGAVFMTGAGPPPELADSKRRVPGFDFPEDAARALAHAASYGDWRRRPSGAQVEPPGCRPAAAASIIARALADGGGWLSPSQVSALFACYRLPLAPSRTARSAGEAAAAAAGFDGAVALKAIAPGLLHKSDAGGVLLGLEGEAAVRDGAHRLARSVADSGAHMRAILVQPMVASEVELLMGVVHDESFGPVIACGAGGTRAELLADVAVRITPLTDLDAREMLRSLRCYPLLEGYRGAPACDIPALEGTLLRLSAMVQAHPQIAELDANPVAAGPDGATILDARVRLAPAAARRPEPSLRA